MLFDYNPASLLEHCDFYLMVQSHHETEAAVADAAARTVWRASLGALKGKTRFSTSTKLASMSRLKAHLCESQLDYQSNSKFFSNLC